MSTFRIGQRVICVRSLPGFVEKGNHYTITGVFNLCSCGDLVTVGVMGRYVSGNGYILGAFRRCASCRSRTTTPTLEKLIQATLFRPLIEDLTAELALKEAQRIQERPDIIHQPQPLES